MALKFRGYLKPNIQRDAREPLEIRFNKPRKADGVTVQIKELDTYLDSVRKKKKRRQKREETEDDLLATFTGKIRNRQFIVESHTNESDDTSLPVIKIRFQGSNGIYEIPVVSEEEENEGIDWEIAFTVQYPGQEDYSSPIAFIRLPRGKALIVDDEKGYEEDVNSLYHLFKSKSLESEVLRGYRAKKKIKYYHEVKKYTTEYRDGFDYKVFKRMAPDFNYIYFNCHGGIDLTGDAKWIFPCVICSRRFDQQKFKRCRHDKKKCNNTGKGRGYYRYRSITEEFVLIKISKEGKEDEIDFYNDTDLDLSEIVGDKVALDEYKDAFIRLNKDNKNLKMEDKECKIKVPNTFRFPTLLAFPGHDYRKNWLPHKPVSDYLHGPNAEDTPGVPAISFGHHFGESTGLSDEVSATPSEDAGSPPELSMEFLEDELPLEAILEDEPLGEELPLEPLPDGPPPDEPAGEEPLPKPNSFDEPQYRLAAKPYNGSIKLTWEEVPDAYSYTLYRSNKPGVNEQNARVIKKNYGSNSYVDRGFKNKGLKNGRTYYYRIQAKKWGGGLTPDEMRKMDDLSQIKIFYVGACYTGRKKELADAALDKGVIFFIGHQISAARSAENLANQFWKRWLKSGAKIRNVIGVYNRAVRSNAKDYKKTYPVIYYRNKENKTKWWRPTQAVPDPKDIKLE